MNICVVGAGRIGLHVLTHLRRGRPGDSVAAVDVDQSKVEGLAARGWTASTSYPAGDAVDVWILCVSTGPELAWLFDAVSRIAPKPGALVTVESTIPVGTTRRIAAAFEQRGAKAGRDFHLVHAPHRVLFGAEEDPARIVRVIAGMTETCLDAGIRFYAGCGIPLHPVTRPEIAELSKIVENSIRYLEISFAETLSLACSEAGLDFDELREAVNTKTNVHLADVDYGIGGECLPKDLEFLQSWLKSPLLAEAEKADLRYREHMRRAARNFGKILLDGLTYKPGVRSLQGSRAVELGLELLRLGTEVYARDPLLTAEEIAALGFRPWREGQPVDGICRRGKWQAEERRDLR